MNTLFRPNGDKGFIEVDHVAVVPILSSVEVPNFCRWHCQFGDWNIEFLRISICHSDKEYQ